MLILITFYLFSGYCFVYSRAKIQQKRMKSFASKRQAIKIIISLYLIGICIRPAQLAKVLRLNPPVTDEKYPCQDEGNG